MRIAIQVPILLAALSAAASAEVTFRPVDITIDAGRAQLGAYQVEITYDRATTTVAGLEGGQTDAFARPPFYDPAGMREGRIVVASFVDPEIDLEHAPGARTRVARLHLQIDAPDLRAALSKMTIRVVTAVDTTGRRIPASAELATAQVSRKESV
jgi:hypothetical protein